MNKYLITILFLLISQIVSSHPLHVTVTNIEADEDKGIFTVCVKLFIDDLENILEQKYNQKINLKSTVNEKETQTHLINYIKEHLYCGPSRAKSEEINFNFVKKEIDNESIWIFLEMPYFNNEKKLLVTNTLMMDLFYDQINLFIMYYNENEIAEQFSLHEQTKIISFE